MSLRAELEKMLNGPNGDGWECGGCEHENWVDVDAILAAVDAHIKEAVPVAAEMVADRSWQMSYQERFEVAKEIIIKAMADEGEVY